jgi:mannose-1-phosphate guanylyltransferase/phosphomannomutase
MMQMMDHKARITITLRQDLLPLLDHFVDGKNIRNRSHAIEYILGKHLGMGIQHAVVLAGVDEHGTLPALTHVRNRPAIAYTFEMLRAHGIRNVILVVNKNGQPLKDLVGDGAQWGLRVVYVEDQEGSGTAHALSLVAPFVKQTFLVIYSDMLADINLSDFVENHKQGGLVCSVALSYNRSPEQYGVARMEGTRVVEYSEKPGKEGKHGMMNAGLYICEPKIFDYITKDTHSLEKEVLSKIAADKNLLGYPFQGKWFDISKEGGRIRAEQEWR